MKKIWFILGAAVVCTGYAQSGFADPVIRTCDDTVCRTYPTGGNLEQNRCVDKSANESCTSASAGEKSALCKDLGGDELSCTARECLSDYSLWLTTARSTPTKPLPQSQGRCFSVSKMEAWCKQGCGCKANEECVFNEYSGNYLAGNSSYTAPTKTKAFVGEEACHCVAKTTGQPVVEDEPSVETDCEVSVAFQITCPDGTKWAKNRKYKVKKSDFANMNFENCQEFTDALGNENQGGLDLSLTTLLANETASYQAITDFAKLVCKGRMTVVETPDVLAAKRTINSFIATAKSEKRDVWTSADGTFNTARLASDLTAGVVLGTVGGVVSGVVIKKKQVEKGFDALHCTVGGQTVADWGDEFMVGLVR
jgi:hypothetical protein